MSREVVILFASDIHSNIGFIHRLNDEMDEINPDIIIICGDITDFGSLSELEELLSIIGENRKVHKLFVPGNCDPEESSYIGHLGGAINLHGIQWRYHNYTFAGVGGSLTTPFGTPLEFDEADFRRILKAIDEPSILVSHSPPYKTKVDRIYRGTHIGSIALRDYITRCNPSLVICGHVHEAMGKDILDRSIIVNPGPGARGFYGIAVLNNEIDVKLKRL
jgi:hypothetical protein